MSANNQALEVRAATLHRELSPFFDIPLRISIEVGRTRIRVGDLIRLAQGSIIELKKPAGEPFDVCVNGHMVAKGEIIVVDQTAGIRIIEVPRQGV